MENIVVSVSISLITTLTIYAIISHKKGRGPERRKQVHNENSEYLRSNLYMIFSFIAMSTIIYVITGK